MEFLNDIYNNITVKKAIYFLISIKIRHYDVLEVIRIVKDEGYSKLILEAINWISQTLDKHENAISEIVDHFNNKEPYHHYLYKELNQDIGIIILCYLIKFFDYKEIFNVPLERIPEYSNNKYKLTEIENQIGFNHEGIALFDRFYYYSPLIWDRIAGSEPPTLIKELIKLNDGYNKLAMRLDETISVEKAKYKKKYLDYSEIFRGKIINLDRITFPLYKGGNETLCVYNPKNMKKIQFKISNRQDSEKWIEVEELWYINEGSKRDVLVTRYLHSIFEPERSIFTHIDGSINFYSKDNYIIRQKQTINSHADSHHKLWLIEGKIGIIEWGKLILAYFRDNDLIFDAFEGRLVEEIFDDMIYPS